MIRFNRWKLMSEALELLGRAVSIEAALEVLRARARAIGCADGVALVRRDGDDVVNVGEDSIAPLWPGGRFPVEHSITARAMIERRPIFIPDVRADPLVPPVFYLGTFVHSMAILPLGTSEPVAALCVFWGKDNPAEPDALALLDTLARSVNSTFERLAIAREIAESRPAV